jgi:transposase
VSRAQAAQAHLEKKVLIASERDRPDVAEQRELWFAGQSDFDPSRLVFLDETWVKTNLTRPRGRAPEGERLIDKIPHGHWKTTTFLAALRCTGLTAPLVIDGGINGELFLAYVRQQLVPTLRPGDIVVMDNLSSHKVSGVREAIQGAKSQVLYLPPYSPDLNPIETVFSKFKWMIRSAKARTVEGLWNACGQVSALFSESECRRHFRHCGYRYD